MTTKTIYDIWTCVFCKRKAKDVLSLEMQFLDGDVLFFDDQLAWYRCDNCATAEHFSCLLAKTQKSTSVILISGRTGGFIVVSLSFP